MRLPRLAVVMLVALAAVASAPTPGHADSDVANTGPACGKHNLIKTRGYTTWRDPTGHWHITRPDGTEIQPV